MFILYGISGAGKTTLGKVLASWGLKEIVSHTTRPMRNGEIDGVDYYFVDDETFDNIEFIETSEVPAENNLYKYGLSKKEVDEKLKWKKGAYAILNREGYAKLKELYPNEVKGIFIIIDRQTAYERMIERGDSHEYASSRLDKFKDSYENNVQFPDDILLLNSDMDESTNKLHEIVTSIKE